MKDIYMSLNKEYTMKFPLVLVFFGMLIALQSVAFATDIYVPTNYSTIQEAIDNSTNGDTVYIEDNGFYSENLTIDKQINLFGLGTNIIINGSGFATIDEYPPACYIKILQEDVDKYGVSLRGDVITVNADNVNITNLTVKNSRGYYSDAAIYVNDSMNVNITDVNIEDSCYGILFYKANDSTVDNIDSTNDMDYSIVLRESIGNLIKNSNGNVYVKENSEFNSIENVISNNRTNAHGILVAENARNNTFKNNSVRNNWKGMKIIKSHNNTVEGGNITSNDDYDLLIISGNNNRIKDVVFGNGIDINGVTQVNVNAYKAVENPLDVVLSDYFDLSTTESGNVTMKIWLNKTYIEDNNLTADDIVVKWYNETSSQWENVTDRYIDEVDWWARVNVSHFSLFVATTLGSSVVNSQNDQNQNQEQQSTSSGSGGGGGGGSVITQRDYAINLLSKIVPNKAAEVRVDREGVSLKQITIDVLNEVNNVKVTVKKLDKRPATVIHSVSGNVYQYIEIEKENIEDQDIRSAKIRFLVKKEWIRENNINESTISLNRYDNAWQRLDTKKVVEYFDSIEYEAYSPGFSVFAVSGEEKIEEMAGSVQQVATEEGSVNQTTGECTGEICQVGEIEDRGMMNLVGYIVFLILIIVGIYYFGVKRE